MNTLEHTIGNTPLVKLQRMGPDNGSEIWVKLEGNNPAGSVKDRAALSMIVQAEKRGEIQPGDVLIEATSGNTGIALAMIAALKGYRMTLLMPDNMSQERRAAMRAYGAELILVTKEEGSSIPGIRRWPAEYMPGIYNAQLVDQVLDIHQREAENTMRELAVREGIFCGVSSGGAVAGALRVAQAHPGAVVVAIICDRGDRYLSTGVFGEESYTQGAGI